ncbi:MAG: hypothetical protein HQK60_03195 [Deltaproteobacteria bacterium]|nr:hypothetical protein [Deltaproteobacteria bacterium]
MSDPTVKATGSNATKLVWMVTLLGFSVGMIMLGILYWAISRIHSDREHLLSFQVNMTRMITSLDTTLIQGQSDLGSLLGRKDTKSADPNWLDKLSVVIDMGNSDTVGDSEIQHNISLLQNQLTVLKDIRRECVAWSAKNASAMAVFPIVSQLVRSNLEAMRSTVIKIEGRERLRRALKIRQYREGPGQPGDMSAFNLISQFGSNMDIVTVKTELSDLAWLCERLLGEDSVDALVDLKDNRLKSTLDRLRRGINNLEESKLSLDDLSPTNLDNFEESLFGQGYRFDDTHQTIIPGKNGLYTLCHDRLLLRDSRLAFLNQVADHFDIFRSIRTDLVSRVEAFASQTAIKAEKALTQALKTMLLVSLISAVVFLILSAKIVHMLKRQIRSIEITNENLKSEILVRQRVEDELRESQEALHRAKDELETRVEERTYELKQANALLGKEVTERKRAEEELLQRGQDLIAALEIARKARETAEAERDKSEKMLAEVSESKRRLEIMISDATSREKRMVELKEEVNDLLSVLGKETKYHSPGQVLDFLVQQRTTSNQQQVIRNL